MPILIVEINGISEFATLKFPHCITGATNNIIQIENPQYSKPNKFSPEIIDKLERTRRKPLKLQNHLPFPPSLGQFSISAKGTAVRIPKKFSKSSLQLGNRSPSSTVGVIVHRFRNINSAHLRYSVPLSHPSSAVTILVLRVSLFGRAAHAERAISPRARMNSRHFAAAPGIEACACRWDSRGCDGDASVVRRGRARRGGFGGG